MNEADFVEAGLYDPEAPGAATRLALLEYLADRGATIEEMVVGADADRLRGLAGELVRRSRRSRVTPRSLADDGTISLETFAKVWRAAGLTAVDPDDEVLSDADRQVFTVFGSGEALFGQAAALQFTRTIGAAVATIADAAMATFGLTVEADSEVDGRDELAHAQLLEAASTILVDEIPLVIAGLFRHHIDAAVRRYLAGGAGEMAQLAVGFLDVVGSTGLTQEFGPAALGAAISEFEQEATELVALHEGRLVKTIGDEVMFVTTSADAAGEIALALIDYAESHPRLRQVRGALVWGALARGFGDYYGPVVNLAARAVKSAEPGCVVVDAETAALLTQSRFRVTSTGQHSLRGFPGTVELFRVDRERRDT